MEKCHPLCRLPEIMMASANPWYHKLAVSSIVNSLQTRQKYRLSQSYHAWSTLPTLHMRNGGFLPYRHSLHNHGGPANDPDDVGPVRELCRQRQRMSLSRRNIPLTDNPAKIIEQRDRHLLGVGCVEFPCIDNKEPVSDGYHVRAAW